MSANNVERLKLGTVLLIPLLAACGPAAVTGELSADGSCSATIGDAAFTGPPDGVRIVYRLLEGVDEPDRQVLIAYCLLTTPDEIPVRIDFVKMNATTTGILEPGTYLIDARGDRPRTIGVIVTAPGYLDLTRDWRPTTGTLKVDSSTASTLAATFEMELRAGGTRTY